MFMDELNRATYHEIVHGGHKDETHRVILSQYRQALRRAQRFLLDDASVQLVCEMTRYHSRMNLWSILARLPYDTMWLEFNLHTKIKKFDEMGTLKHPFKPEEVSPICGYLLQKDLDSQTRWVATEFVEVNGVPIPQPVALVFDPEGSVLKPVTGCVLWNEVTLSKRFGSPIIPVSVEDNSGNEVTLSTQTDPEFCYFGLMSVEDGILAMPEEQKYKVGAVVERMWRGWVRDSEKLKGIVFADAIERSGVLKWLITALAMINDVPKSVKAKPARLGKMLTRGAPTDYLTSSIISINIPKSDVTRYVSRHLTSAAVKAQRAWHRVRGHWRIIDHAQQRGILCRHEPTLVENGVAICSKCERLIRWINNYSRGSPELGQVDHGYVVKSN